MSGGRSGHPTQRFTVRAIVNGGIIQKSGDAFWAYDAIGLFMSITPEVRYRDIISVKSEDGKEHIG